MKCRLNPSGPVSLRWGTESGGFARLRRIEP